MFSLHPNDVIHLIFFFQMKCDQFQICKFAEALESGMCDFIKKNVLKGGIQREVK